MEKKTKNPTDFTKIKVVAGKQKENEITHSLKKQEIFPVQFQHSRTSAVKILANTSRSASQTPDTVSKQTATLPSQLLQY